MAPTSPDSPESPERPDLARPPGPVELPGGCRLRLATPEDAELIAGHRESMFVEMGMEYAESVAKFAPWGRERIADGSYLGLLAEVPASGRVVAGAGLWLMDWPPHVSTHVPIRAYLLNVWTDHDHRGQGIAAALTRTAMEMARARGIGVMRLHASDAGRPIYTRLGFTPSNEMTIDLTETQS